MGRGRACHHAGMSQMAAWFGFDATVAAALQFEAELAAACAEHGLISNAAAEAIRRACETFDGAGLEAEAAHAGTLAIPLVARLRAKVPEHAEAVHLGATSQDVADTALMLQCQRARACLEDEGRALTARLAELAEQHVHTPAMGRTLLQPAEPITAGVRFAGWGLGLDDALARLGRDALAVQLGGPVGLLTSLGPAARLIRQSLARRLGLADQLAWHTRRGAIAALGASLAIVTGAAAKMARDVSLLMQPELAELAEPLRPGRGGSSSMPHKRNPADCQVVLSAALRAPHLAASLLSALPQELERGLGGWQAEAPLLADLFELAHTSLVAMRATAAGLEIHAPPLSLSPATLAAATRFVSEALASLAPSPK